MYHVIYTVKHDNVIESGRTGTYYLTEDLDPYGSKKDAGLFSAADAIKHTNEIRNPLCGYGRAQLVSS